MAANFLNKIKRETLIAIIIAAALVGVVAASYTALAKLGAASHEVCSVSESFNCEIVNTSQWSEIAGIPVSVLGLISYVLFIIGSLIVLKKPQENIETLLGALAIVGLLFSLYLTSIEAFVLHAWCMFCIASQIAILIIAAAVMMLRYKDFGGKNA